MEEIVDKRKRPHQLILIPTPHSQDLDHPHHHLVDDLIQQPMLEKNQGKLLQHVIGHGVLEEVQDMESQVTPLQTHRSGVRCLVTFVNYFSFDSPQMVHVNQSEVILPQAPNHQRILVHHDTPIVDQLILKTLILNPQHIIERKELKSVRQEKQILTKLFDPGVCSFLVTILGLISLPSGNQFTSEYDTLVSRKNDSSKKATRANSQRRHQTDLRGENEQSSIFDSFQLTSGNLKSFETTNQLSSSFSTSRRDPSSSSPFHPKPPLHQNHASLLDEIESSATEDDDEREEDRVRHSHPGVNSYLEQRRNSSGDEDGDDDDDSEGGMIFPTKPSVEYHEPHRGVEIDSVRKMNNKSPSQQQRDEEGERGRGDDDEANRPQGVKSSDQPSLARTETSNRGGQSDIDQRINALQKFLQKAR
jgi:hypothetical protein